MQHKPALTYMYSDSHAGLGLDTNLLVARVRSQCTMQAFYLFSHYFKLRQSAHIYRLSRVGRGCHEVRILTRNEVR